MIRAFVVGLLALGGLLIVARSFPAPPGSRVTLMGGGIAGADLGVEGLARRDGMWEGARRLYALDGELRSQAAVRLEITSLSPEAQSINLSEMVPGSAPVRRHGRITMTGSAMEMRLWDAAGGAAVWTGRDHGRSILWHRRDDRSGVEESLHEEVVRQADGDVFLVRGWLAAGPERLFVEALYRRSEQDEP
ncbi:MAG: hypothetical protein ACREAA_21420 [Candidatus Polarisedimenticolia bacterium]